jgi:hypothetical protein
MNEPPGDLTELVDHIEAAIEAINNAVVAAGDLEYAEAALWLEWIAEELGDLLSNVMHVPPMDEV